MRNKRPRTENQPSPSSLIPHTSSLIHDPSSFIPHPSPLILASGSPRRRELLTEAGYTFEVVVPSETAECGVCSRESPEALVARLARQKAADVAGRIDRGLIVACDTVAECDGQILGKPANEDHARRMLQMLSGREHHVLSGLCLWPVEGGTEPGAGSGEECACSPLPAPCSLPHARVAVTRLRMDQLTPGQIDEYVASGLWEGKAGGFGYQDRGYPLAGRWLHVISGSESNVVGLPLELLAEMLRAMSYEPDNSTLRSQSS